MVVSYCSNLTRECSSHFSNEYHRIHHTRICYHPIELRKYLHIYTPPHRYEFEKRAQIRQESSLRRAALNGKRQLPATRLRCFEGNIPFLNPNLEKMLSRRVMESGGGGGESK